MDVQAETEKKSHGRWWRKLTQRMGGASSAFGSGVRRIVLRRGALTDEFYDDILELLIEADTGMTTAEALVEGLRQRVKSERISDAGVAVQALREAMLTTLQSRDRDMPFDGHPTVVLMVGVNGSGKTTTVGKLAHRLRSDGKTSLIAAADTYRAAAIDQVREWAEKSDTHVVAHQPNADPGAVVFDALQAGVARKADVVIIDTAGRLHTKANLMAELEKVRRVIQRVVPEGPHETLLVLEAPTGMNAIAQARAFHASLGLTGVVLTKLDGSARGGTLFAIEQELGVPVKLVGMGEGIDDLNLFDPQAYIDALFAGAETG